MCTRNNEGPTRVATDALLGEDCSSTGSSAHHTTPSGVGQARKKRWNVGRPVESYAIMQVMAVREVKKARLRLLLRRVELDVTMPASVCAYAGVGSQVLCAALDPSLSRGRLTLGSHSSKP